MKQKISTIKHHTLKAHEEATKLLANLKDARSHYLKNLENENETISAINRSFETWCAELIMESKPVLEKDLGWGDYLLNLLKAISNVIIKVATFGRINTFFSLAKSELLLAFEDTESRLVHFPKHEI